MSKKGPYKKDTPLCFRADIPTEDETYAFKAFSKGEADAHQQQLVMKYIVQKLSRPHDHCFVVDSDRESTFLSGRAFVGLQILKILNVRIGQPKEAEPHE